MLLSLSLCVIFTESENTGECLHVGLHVFSVGFCMGNVKATAELLPNLRIKTQEGKVGLTTIHPLNIHNNNREHLNLFQYWALTTRSVRGKA